MAQIIGVMLYLGTLVIEVCRFIATVGAAIIVVAVITWGFVEDEAWTLREALRLVSAICALLALIGGVVAVVLLTRSGS